MRKKQLVLSIFLMLGLGLIFAQSLVAVEVKTPQLSSTNPLNNITQFFTDGGASSDLGGLVSVIIAWMILGAGLTSFIYLIIGGFKWLTAQGDPKALTAAQQTIFGAVIGFIITFAAYWIIEILQTVLGIKILAEIASPTYAQVDIRTSFLLDQTRSINQVFPGLAGRSGLGGFISSLVLAAITVAGIAFLGYFILGAFKFIAAGGDQKAVDGAKKTLTSAAIGLLIVFTSYWIIEILQTITGVPILP